MTVTNYQQWRADGSPWKPAVCVDSLAEMFRGYGHTVYIIGNDDHLKASTPEDHTPYSHTPWPGSQPYPYVDALDVMPDGRLNLAKVGAQIVADKNAGKPGTECIKYINWTDSSGNCYHDSWMPNHARRDSSDRGHIHISTRTDYVLKPTSYDPNKTDPGRTLTYMELQVKVPVLKQGDSDNNIPGYNLITRMQRITGATDDGDWGPNTTQHIADWCDKSPSECRTLTEDIYRKVFGAGR